MIVALTGGTGFLGNHVLDALLEHGHQIRALARRPQRPCDGVEWIPGSLQDPASLALMCQGAAAVIHVAGVVNAPDATGFDMGNRVGTVAVVAAAKAAGIERFVHVSSLAAKYPHLSVYGASKLAGEQVAAASGLDVRIIRPPGIFGPGDTETLDLFRMAARGVALLPPRGRGSWIYAKDLAELIVALAEADDAPSLVEADDGRAGGWTHEAFAGALGAATGRGKVMTFHAPAWLLRLAARADGLVRGKGAKLTADRAGYLAHPDWTIDPALRPSAALWQPQTTTVIGLERTVDWYRQRGVI